MRTELFMYFLVLRVLSRPGLGFVRRGWSATGRSGAVVPMLFLFCVALWFALRGTSCLVLPCSLSVPFFCPFGILVALPGKGGRWEGLVFVLVVHLFVSYAHVNLCHFFTSTWCRGLAAASVCGSSWTFLFTFL